ncbi:MAG TPA: aspartate aminotransferase family protein [Nitrososphaerales archaeon]|nr:aspartate aminotransferase family protein [Nitrososphaerales archaeon]
MSEGYESRTPKGRRVYDRARRVFAGGVNHNARFFEPYPLFAAKARGKHIWDEDGNRYTDYWMGHMALILGHSPKVVVEALRAQIENGTHYGTSSRQAVELGEEIQRDVPCAEMMRFCNSGAEATMYLVRLARGYTRRRMIVKMEGGWHGYNTELNRAVSSPSKRPEGTGILEEEQSFVTSVPFNDLGAVERVMKGGGSDVAAVLVEPVLGAGGCIPADPDYLAGLRELTSRYGALLAFDEIITGFRLALGGAQERYGIEPDIATLGKVAGGGLPLGLVCGRGEVISEADPTKKKVSMGGGTFSENPLTMVAGLATLRYLRKNREKVYGSLEEMGKRARREVDEAFDGTGLEAETTGLGSLFLTHFPGKKGEEKKRIETAYALSLMADGIFTLPGHPNGVSTVHTTLDIDRLAQASGRFAQGATAAQK